MPLVRRLGQTIVRVHALAIVAYKVMPISLFLSWLA